MLVASETMQKSKKGGDETAGGKPIWSNRQTTGYLRRRDHVKEKKLASGGRKIS